MLWNYKQSKDLETLRDGNLLLTIVLQSSGVTRTVTHVSTNLWQTRTDDSTTVNHWTLLPHEKTWKTGLMQQHTPCPLPVPPSLADNARRDQLTTPMPWHSPLCQACSSLFSPQGEGKCWPLPLSPPKLCEDLHRLCTPSGWNHSETAVTRTLNSPSHSALLPTT